MFVGHFVMVVMVAVVGEAGGGRQRGEVPFLFQGVLMVVVWVVLTHGTGRPRGNLLVIQRIPIYWGQGRIGYFAAWLNGGHVVNGCWRGGG